jgi:hypothetical protein
MRKREKIIEKTLRINEKNQGIIEKREIYHVQRVYFNQIVSKYSDR